MEQTPIQALAQEMATAYKADGEQAARKIMNDYQAKNGLKTFEYVVLTDTFRKLVKGQ